MLRLENYGYQTFIIDHEGAYCCCDDGARTALESQGKQFKHMWYESYQEVREALECRDQEAAEIAFIAAKIRGEV